jgi:hypothetical protein
MTFSGEVQKFSGEVQNEFLVANGLKVLNLSVFYLFLARLKILLIKVEKFVSYARSCLWQGK